MDVQLQETVATTMVLLATVGLRVLGAIVLWLIGRRLIKLAVRLTAASMAAQKVDSTLINYLKSALSILLNVILIVALLGFFGIETTTFAAVLAAGGVAIGVAWSGLLANFAAGTFLIVLRPFKVGDLIAAGGITGTVEEIGLFGTTINTPDNVKTIVGNNKIFGDNIQNFSANPHRRVDLVAQLGHGVDAAQATELLKTRLAKIPNVLTSPAPQVEILEFTSSGPVLAVRPYCHNDHYWQVYFDTNRSIRECFGEAGYPVPGPLYLVRNQA